MYFVNVKGKVRPITGHGDPEGGLRSIALLFFLTSALDGGGWSTPRPGRFTPMKDLLPIVFEADCEWAPRTGLDGCRKSLPPTGFDPRTVQPVANRYTD